jgi:hypothetical protein
LSGERVDGLGVRLSVRMLAGHAVDRRWRRVIHEDVLGRLMHGASIRRPQWTFLLRLGTMAEILTGGRRDVGAKARDDRHGGACLAGVRCGAVFNCAAVPCRFKGAGRRRVR